MPKFIALALAGLVLCALPSYAAESTPYDEAQQREGLKQLYANCMGGVAAHADPDRHRFCVCVSDKSSRLSAAAYASMAAEQLTSPNTPPTVVREIAEICMQEILNRP